ncbi:glycine zipper 2TM domain-containing protein [Sphingobium lignivorans]|uniref:17 kDa surface antigen n=1 Tax=Sphingobium lignivorans TaxID=2735886 RepID=A0ABR6NJA6_9SPHN|nr:glycine zipper 2TM domain-containing protein [Sphingobium lignivorans]MBB5987186.1 hypothetical protein [Sphingobium lignivorans]
MTIPHARALFLAPVALVLALPLGACSDYGNDRPRYGYRGDGHRGGEHVMGRNDRVYRDRDGNYYCQKPDGTRGTIIGGLAGGVLGNVIAPDGNKTLGTILGAAGGAVIGREVDRGQVRCR